MREDRPFLESGPLFRRTMPSRGATVHGDTRSQLSSRYRAGMKAPLTAVLVLATLHSLASAQVEGLGKIDFPNSGAPEAQEAFRKGVLLLHSFEYEDAAEEFGKAQEIDPDFVLAYWGEALTHSHPIWNEEDPEKAYAVLSRLGPDTSSRLARARTERERGFLESVEVLFGEGDRPTRNRAYELRLAELHDAYPDDMEVAAFHSLSILGTATNGRDIPTYMRAAAIAEEVFLRNPDHPGALHYAIHSYDDPVHAPLGLRMANRYAKVAAAAAHALHMPSHIYVALGMWDESIASNIDSAAAADARRARKGLHVDDRGYHSLSWLAYSYLQKGRSTASLELVRDMRRDCAEAEGSSRSRHHVAVMRAHHVVALDAWNDEQAGFEVEIDGLSISTRATELLVRGVTRMRRRDVEGAEQILTELRTILDQPVQPVDEGVGGCCAVSPEVFGEASPRMKAALVTLEELAAYLALERLDSESALDHARLACELEDAMGFDFGPPIVVKPAHELLGEILLVLGRPEEAVMEFEAALGRAPGRARSLLGLARGLGRAGKTKRALAVFSEIARIWDAADEDHPGLEDVRQGLRADR